MSRVRLERVTFAYADAAPILEDAELTLDDGWTGLVGENGAGKSSLLALVAGALAPRSGALRVEPVVLCAQRVDEPGPDDPKDGDARGVLAKNLAGWAEDRLGRQVGILRREAARAAEAVPQVPVEKTVGRSVFVGFERAPRYPGALLLVTHDDAFAARCTRPTWRLSGGRVEG